MQSRTFIRLIVAALTAAALPAYAQSGLRLPPRDAPGIDPAFARGWLAPEYDRFGFARHQWRDMVGFAPSRRMNWAYALGARGSLGMSYSSTPEPDPSGLETRRFGLFGRYAVSQDWSLSAEAVGREPGAMLRLNDFRVGVHRRF